MVTWTPGAIQLARIGIGVGVVGFALAMLWIADETHTEGQRRMVLAAVLAVIVAVPLSAVDWQPGPVCDWNQLVANFGYVGAWLLWVSWGC